MGSMDLLKVESLGGVIAAGSVGEGGMLVLLLEITCEPGLTKSDFFFSSYFTMS